jgi:proteasome accessory factor A
MKRSTPFAEIVRALIPFFVTRQIFTGTGRLGRGTEGQQKEFQISQRADYFEVEVGLETTLKRPLINTRDEPHADPEKYRRLHVIIGDANLSDTATLLKMGSTSIVLSMIEAGLTFDDRLDIKNPVRELTQVSYDTSLTHQITMSSGASQTAIEIQFRILESAISFCESQSYVDPDTREVLELWQSTLESLNRDPMECVSTLDWVAKMSLMQGYIRRDNCSWDDPRLALLDLQYSDIDPSKGIAAKLEEKGALVRIFTDAEVNFAVSNPPSDTRAFFRGECIRRYPENIAAASWDSVVFDTGGDTLLRVPTLEPLKGTKDTVLAVLDASPTAVELLDSLRDPP